MGMNRKWNMKVFELHSTDVGHADSTEPTEPAEEVGTDTTVTEITMQKAPFNYDSIKEDEGTLSINIGDLTASTEFTEEFFDSTTWNYIEGNSDRVTIQNDGSIKITSVTKATYDLPTESTRWVLKFDHLINSHSFRSFFGFGGTSESETAVRYGYGMDVPRTGNPRLEVYTGGFTEDGEVVEQTIADEEYFTGQDYMSVVLTRWDDVFTLCYDDRYLITIPIEEELSNRIGFWTWGNSNMFIKNPEFYIIDDDSENISNVIINFETDDSGSGQSGSGEPGSGQSGAEEPSANESNTPLISLESISEQEKPFKSVPKFAQDVSLADLTPSSSFATAFADTANWSGNNVDITVDANDNLVISNSSEGSNIVSSFNFAEDETRWIFTCEYKIDDVSKDNLFLFNENISQDWNGDFTYRYGVLSSAHWLVLQRPVGSSGYTSLQEFAHNVSVVPTNRNIPLMLVRWGNVCTLYFDNTYMITIPMEQASNAIGFLTEDNTSHIINPKMYLLNEASWQDYSQIDIQNTENIFVTDNIFNSND